jgi:hypothetical protein
MSPDHIIPRAVFARGSANRPTLPTHDSCNKKKSKDDEWFKHTIDLMCAATSAMAGGSFIQFLQKASVESGDAYLVGTPRQRLRNYRLAREILSPGPQHGLEVTHAGQRVPQIGISEKNRRRLDQYMQRLCYGLYLRNVRGAAPNLPWVGGFQYARAYITGENAEIHADAMDLIRQSLNGNAVFAQTWGERLTYAGSRAAEDATVGFLYVEFLQSAGFLALFGEIDAVSNSSTA